MDTSPEYISMCRRAKELQEMWEPSTGDYCASSAGGCNRILVVIADLPNKFLVVAYPYATYDNTDHILKQNIIWLPRIDQLIDMMGNDLRPDEGFTMTIQNRMTTEQELLNEHYKNTCHKSWNGEDWIKL